MSPPDTRKQLNKSGPGTPNPSRLWLLLLTGPGSHRSWPALRQPGTAKSAECGQQSRSDAWPSRQPRLPEKGGRPSLKGDSSLPDPLPDEHVQAPWSIFRAGSRPERREARNKGLVEAQAPDRLLQIEAQAPGYPAVYMEKNGSTSSGSRGLQG